MAEPEWVEIGQKLKAIKDWIERPEPLSEDEKETFREYESHICDYFTRQTAAVGRWCRKVRRGEATPSADEREMTDEGEIEAFNAGVDPRSSDADDYIAFVEIREALYEAGEVILPTGGPLGAAELAKLPRELWVSAWQAAVQLANGRPNHDCVEHVVKKLQNTGS